MKAVLNSIELTDLNRQDLSFAIPSFAPHLGLCDSLRCCGILQPPWIRAKADGTKIIVDGFKRLEWAFQESFERIRVLLFAAECDPVKLLLDRIEAKLFGPALNVAEKAQIVSKLVQNVAPEVMQSRYLPRLGIAAHPEAIRKWCRLAASDEHLLAAAALEEISDRTALELVDWEKEAQREIISLLKELRCSFSIQSEILERVREIALREESSELQVLNVPELAAIKDDKNRNHREKTQALRDWLYRRRYPRIKAREERFMRDLAASDLPARVRITPPPAFEGQDWQLQLFFGNPGELEQMLGDLQVFAGSAELRSLMGVGNGSSQRAQGHDRKV